MFKQFQNRMGTRSGLDRAGYPRRELHAPILLTPCTLLSESPHMLAGISSLLFTKGVLFSDRNEPSDNVGSENESN